jgi:3-hydroxybutyryl-CoA dehydrogenase
MGNGIAHVFAQNDYKVRIVDTQKEFLDRAVGTITKNLDRQLKKEAISAADRDRTLANIGTALSLDDAADADVAIEAVTENIAIKKGIFRKLDEVCKPETIVASNTSSISITELGGVTRRPDRVIGMHFMNPVPMMKLVEIIRGIATSDQTYQTVKALAEKLGKTPAVANDFPGFVSNRVLMPMINEAIYCVMEGVADKEAIDTVMKLGMNHPMGPLTLADFIGLDVCLAIMEVLHTGLGDDKYRPCPLLRNMVRAGYLGRKSGRGFYSYEGA